MVEALILRCINRWLYLFSSRRGLTFSFRPRATKAEGLQRVTNLVLRRERRKAESGRRKGGAGSSDVVDRDHSEVDPKFLIGIWVPVSRSYRSVQYGLGQICAAA